MQRAHRIAVVIALTVLAVVVPSLAGAHGPMGGTQTTSLSLPANGDGTVQASTMPSNVHSGTIGISSEDAQAFDSLTAFLTNKPTFGARVISCAIMYGSIVNPPQQEGQESYEETDPTLALLFLHVCIKLSFALSAQGAAVHAASNAATAGCPLAVRAAPVTITRSGSGYKAVVNGAVSTPKSLGYRLSCKRTSTKLTISERPRSAKASLSSAVGSRLQVGFQSYSSSSDKLKVALTVK